MAEIHRGGSGVLLATLSFLSPPTGSASHRDVSACTNLHPGAVKGTKSA